MLAASSGMTHLSHLVFLVLGGLDLFLKFNFSLCHMRCLKLEYLGMLNVLQMKVELKDIFFVYHRHLQRAGLLLPLQQKGDYSFPVGPPGGSSTSGGCS